MISLCIDVLIALFLWAFVRQALSNQKLMEMRETFGEERLGLQTGDASLNADAAVVVMTTEILRNIMYRTEAEAVIARIGAARRGERSLQTAFSCA